MYITILIRIGMPDVPSMHWPGTTAEVGELVGVGVTVSVFVMTSGVTVPAKETTRNDTLLGDTI